MGLQALLIFPMPGSIQGVSAPAAIGSVAPVPSFAVPKYVRVLAISIIGILVLVQAWLWSVNVADVEDDFRCFYTAGYLVRTGDAGHLYDATTQLRLQNALISKGRRAIPFVHPPYEALLDAPFTLLNYRGAYFAFLVLNILLLGASFWLLRPRMSNLASVFPWLPLALFVTFLPVVDALMQGQDSVLLLAILAGVSVLMDRKRSVAAGCLLALGLFRFQIVLPIALLFLLWRRWRFCIGFTLSSAALFLLSVAMVGWSGVKAYSNLLLAYTHRVGSEADFSILIRVPPIHMPNLRGLISALHHFHLPDAFLTVMTLAASLAMLYLAARTPAKGSLMIAIPAATLVSYHFLVHDMSVLLLPMVVAMDKFIRFEGTSDPRRWIFRSAALLFAVPLLQIFIYYSEWFVLLALPVLLLFFLLRKFQVDPLSAGRVNAQM